MRNIIFFINILAFLFNFAYGDDLVIRRDYYKTGKLKREIIFNKETKKSQMKIYYETGELIAIIPIKNGEFNGVEKIYFKNGNLKYKTSLKNGVSDGISKAYYKSGKIRSITTYKKGKLTGASKEFYESGNISTLWEHKDGISIGKSYYETGELKSEIKFKGLKLLFIKGYNKKGNPLNGKVSIFYKSEKLNMYGNFIKGHPNGKLTSHFESGGISEIGNFIKGIPDGIHMSYNESGQIFLEVTYKDGEIHGVVKIFSDELPDTIKYIYYKNGKKIKEEIIIK